MMRFSTFGALVAALALTACGSEKGSNTPLSLEISQSLKTAIAAKRRGKAPVRNPTAKQLANTKTAALQVNPEKAGGSDFLRRIAVRKNATGGIREVWQSSDRAQVFLDRGVLVGTRGVGTDLISVDARATISAVKSMRAGAGIRRYTISRGDNTSQEVRFDCRISVVGNSAIVVVNQRFGAVHMKETCTGGVSGEVMLENEYWILPQSGIVKKSRQWAGPASGYFEMILLKG